MVLMIPTSDCRFAALILVPLQTSARRSLLMKVLIAVAC